jgi:hypothetical protein
MLKRFSVNPLVAIVRSNLAHQPFSVVVDFVRHFKEEFRIHGFGFLLDGAAAASDANTALLLSQKR